MKKILFVLCLISSFIVMAQDVTPTVIQKWVLKNSLLDTYVVFEKYQSPRDIVGVYEFLSNGQVKYSLENPQHVGMCGNGMLYYNTFTWKMEGELLTIRMKGGRVAESTFDCEIQYKVHVLNDQSLHLAKLKVTDYTAQK